MLQTVRSPTVTKAMPDGREPEAMVAGPKKQQKKAMHGKLPVKSVTDTSWSQEVQKDLKRSKDQTQHHWL
eukprot:4827280-Ditylum_brightwellii.AAC.1